MIDAGPIRAGHYTHDVLLHARDEEMVSGIRAFVEQGLSSGGHVLVHSSEPKVAMLREALGTHPRLDYGLDEELYQAPTRTLFSYQHAMAESPSGDLWATGTVPLGDDAAGHPAWGRYESLVNEVLQAYPFHGLCTYDTRLLPAATIAAAKATHPYVSTGAQRAPSPDYQDPAAFLDNPLAAVPDPPCSPPTAVTAVMDSYDLKQARDLVATTATCSTALARDVIEDLLVAVSEVLANGLRHGAPPVRVAVWAQPTRLVCQVTDAGPGFKDPLSGYRYPEPLGPQGLWVARQLCDDLFVRNLPGSGCSVLLATG